MLLIYKLLPSTSISEPNSLLSSPLPRFLLFTPHFLSLPAFFQSLPSSSPPPNQISHLNFPLPKFHFPQQFLRFANFPFLSSPQIPKSQTSRARSLTKISTIANSVCRLHELRISRRSRFRWSRRSEITTGFLPVVIVLRSPRL